MSSFYCCDRVEGPKLRVSACMDIVLLARCCLLLALYQCHGLVFPHFGSCYCGCSKSQRPRSKLGVPGGAQGMCPVQSKAWCVGRGTLQPCASPGSLGTALQGHGWLQCVGIAGAIPVPELWDVAGDRACWQSRPGAGFLGGRRAGAAPSALTSMQTFHGLQSGLDQALHGCGPCAFQNCVNLYLDPNGALGMS